MIVLDASVVVEILTNGPLADSLRSGLATRDDPWIVPHLLDVEVISALRRLAAWRRIDSFRSVQLIADLEAPGRTLRARAIAGPCMGAATQLHRL